MRTLVVGGTEFISLHLVRSLLRRGHEVTLFNRGRRQTPLPDGVSVIVGDRKDHAGVRERLRGQRFGGVFDVAYAPTLGEDVAALVDALDGRPHVIFVVGAHKLVPTLEAAHQRIYTHSLPLEDARAQAAYGQHSQVGKILEIHQELPGRIHIVLVREPAGF